MFNRKERKGYARNAKKNGNMKEYAIEEQGLFSEQQKSEISPYLDLKNTFKLGFNFDGHGNLWASYYIGIDWLKENEAYILVNPKILDLDYIRMFLHCLKHSEISKFVNDIYYFDLNKPKIKLGTNDWELTPFMLVHFLSLVDKIVTQGLKKNYTVVEENLNSKIKGKIIWSQQIKKNIAIKREDRVYCRYQEYSVNCLENRLLKKTLLFIQRYSAKHLKQYPEFIRKQNRLLSAFENVSDNISYSEIKRVKVNSLYKEYIETIDLAKQILRHFGYSFKRADDKTIEKELPPFWIDMSKLFELYVYSLLKDEYKDCKIEYQKGTRNQIPDFLFVSGSENLILDTKYKPQYENNPPDIDDIRQLSGYARTVKIREKLNINNDTDIVDCVIIYPITDDLKIDFKGRNLKENTIDEFTKFYKCGIKLPTKNN
jgi:5-methylcytosine-specific restriction enzyme subunit McrC